MAKVIQKQVKEKLEEWASVQAKIAKAERARNKTLAPIQRDYNETVKPILEDCELKAQPWREKAAAIEKEIAALLIVDRDANGNPKPITVSTDAAIATVESKDGARVVDVKKYFDFVKVKTAAFWSSLKVTIKDAEPIVGKNKVNEFSTKTTSYPVSIKLIK